MQLKPQFSYFSYVYIISIYVCISIYIYCTPSACQITFLWTIKYRRKQNHKVLAQGNSVRLTQEESKRPSKYISSLSNDVVGYQEMEAKYLSLWRSYNNGLCLGLRAKQIPSPPGLLCGQGVLTATEIKLEQQLHFCPLDVTVPQLFPCLC